MSSSRLLLVDTASLYFRAFHGVPSSVTSPAGKPVNAVRGLLDMLAHLVDTRRPARLVACWDDDWRPAFRTAALPSYKAHRLADPARNAETVPDALVPQVPVIVDVLAALGICRVGAAGFEADDVAATLAERDAARGGADVEVVSGDRDLFQVVDDARGVRVLYVGRGVRRLEVVDEAWLSGKYGIRDGAAYADLAVLRGDPSDGLPGVPGIGEKTAAGLLARFDGLEALLAAAAAGDPSMSARQRASLVAAAEYVAAATVVARVRRDVPLGPVEDAVPTAPADPAALSELVQEWGIGTSVVRLLRALGWRPDAAEREESTEARPGAQPTEE